jgi:hypothetical protein
VLRLRQTEEATNTTTVTEALLLKW